MTEHERFVAWVHEQGPRQNAAEALGLDVSTVFALMSGKRPITDATRAAWKRAGGDPDIPETVRPFLEAA